MLVFVAGLHGVGKTSLCKKVVDSFEPAFEHFSASQLIKKQLNSEDHFNKDKKTKNIEKNQNALIEALHSIEKSYPRILLDGHFTLINSEGKVVNTPIQTFSQLNMAACILIQAEPSEILERLRKRGECSWTLNQISDHLITEREQAQLVTTNL